jgi:3-hydroxy-3-methylglutaryl CoA synthase
MINWICGAICGSGATLLLYSILVGKRIQEEQDKACKCIYKYEEYRRKIRTLEYQKHELEKKLESSNYTSDYTSDYLGFEETK